MNQNPFTKLSATNMSRGQFLKVLGAGILAVIGITSILNRLNESAGGTQAQSTRKGKGYGGFTKQER
jgi:hypothetical protein